MLYNLKFIRPRASKTIFIVAFLFFLIGMASVWALIQTKSVSLWGTVNVAPVGLVRAAKAENYLILPKAKPLDESQIKVLKVPSQGAETLYVLDFNTPQLCGSGGCLYAVYTEKGKAVLSLLLDPNLPKGTFLFSISEETRNEFSCLAIAQSTQKEDTVTHSRYCYEGTGFVLVNSSITKGGG